MNIYERSLWVMLKGIIGAPLAGVFVYCALSFATEDDRILICASALVMLAILYISIFSESIRIELDSDGILRYIKRGKVLNTFKLPECSAGYSRNSDGAGPFADHSITLQIIEADGRETNIDCSPIGLGRFESLYEQVKNFSRDVPEVLSAKVMTAKHKI
ncbi:MAG: hypothetical protein LBU32_24970 [Clostridiales bacterium]|jgi:hypothetical protein|nr:hypothetical protein [Clostridiales bacterium]